MSPPTSRDVVVIGGGIIGCTTAYYLTRHPSAQSARITLIEASKHGPAQGASGKAGGIVARWAYPKELVDVSFDEHVKLAEELNGKDRWGWRFVNCGFWEGRGDVTQQKTEGGVKDLAKTIDITGCRSHKSKKNLPSDLTWVKAELTDAYTPIAQDGATAQVHPYLFTTSMFELAKERGLTYINGKATAVLHADGQVTGVQFVDPETKETRSLSATHVIVAAGPWSPLILKHLPISHTRAHSITVRPKEGVTISPYVLFTEFNNPQSGRTLSSPEIYPRPDNEVYACGPGDDCILPETVDDVVVDQASCDYIYKYICSISTELRGGKVEKRQACLLPLLKGNDSGPVIAEATNIAKRLYVGTGHSCWVSLFEEYISLKVTNLHHSHLIRRGFLMDQEPQERWLN